MINQTNKYLQLYVASLSQPHPEFMKVPGSIIDGLMDGVRLKIVQKIKISFILDTKTYVMSSKWCRPVGFQDSLIIIFSGRYQLIYASSLHIVFTRRIIFLIINFSNIFNWRWLVMPSYTQNFPDFPQLKMKDSFFPQMNKRVAILNRFKVLLF